ncbi:AsmA family protein [Nitrogeniibacter aestuarii]|uniref:hypothetical protein n=1 Tax=Nitrogeniibacter aestuarii TaxID=2815343 RepID=UPI001E4E8CCD|nr:hypothetical protein [Nitrogeniibacter aestuarii]
MIEEEVVYVRTEEGEAKAKQPRSISSHELRAMLLLIDGRLSVRELRRRFGKSLAIDKSIAELTRLGWVVRDAEHDAAELDLVARKEAPEDEADAIEESPDTALAEVSREAQARAAHRNPEGQSVDLPLTVDPDFDDRKNASMDGAGKAQDDADESPDWDPEATEINTYTIDAVESVEPVEEYDQTAYEQSETMEEHRVDEPTRMPSDERVDNAEAEVNALKSSEPPVLQLDDEPSRAASDTRIEPTAEREPPADELDDARPEPVESQSAKVDASAAESERPGGDRGPTIADRTRGSMIAARFFIERLGRLILPLAAVAAVIALVAGAFLLPERHRDDIEAAIVDHLGRPVTMSELRLTEAGGGSLALERVAIPALPSVNAKAVLLKPDWSATLSSFEWRFVAVIVGLNGQAEELGQVMQAPLDYGRLTGIQLVDAGVTVGVERWGGLSGSMAVIGSNGEHEAELYNEDRSLTIKVRPGAHGLALNVVGIQRPLAVFPALKFDSYEMQAELEAERLTVSAFGAAGFGGKVTGEGTLLSAPIAQLDGSVGFSKVDIERFIAVLGWPIALSGSADASLAIKASAETPSLINRTDSLNGSFSVDSGALGRMDFGAALRERGRGKIQGGETRFERLAGDLSYQDGAINVTIKSLDAGALDASGRLLMAVDGELSGRMSAVVASAGRQVRTPITVSGTVTAPVLETPKPVVPVIKAEPVVPAPSTSSPALESSVPGDEVPVAPGELRQ